MAICWLDNRAGVGTQEAEIEWHAPESIDPGADCHFGESAPCGRILSE